MPDAPVVDVAALRDLLAKATPGPWLAASNNRRKDGVGIVAVGPVGDEPAAPIAVLAGARHTIKTRAANTALIAAAVNALPALLSERAELTAEAARLRGDIERLTERLREALQGMA